MNSVNLVDISTTAHTVSNLLTSLNLSTSQLLYCNDPQLIKEYVKQTDATINSVVSAIQHMTILDKIEKGKLKPSYIRTDITKLLYRIKESKSYKWPQIKINLHGERVVRAADSFFLEVIFNELMDNSCRYLSQSVDVSINTAGDKTKVLIKDDGEGIEPRELSRVFEPYYRIEKHRRRNNRAGLGLTTVKAIASRIEGNVKINSSPNWGTKVELII